MLDSLLFYAGFLLLIIPFSEDFRNLVNRLWDLLRQYPTLKIVIYPLALLLVAAAVLIIGNSLKTLFITLKFSYE